jgi:hypothetical protein
MHRNLIGEPMIGIEYDENIWEAPRVPNAWDLLLQMIFHLKNCYRLVEWLCMVSRTLIEPGFQHMMDSFAGSSSISNSFLVKEEPFSSLHRFVVVEVDEMSPTSFMRMTFFSLLNEIILLEFFSVNVVGKEYLLQVMAFFKIKTQKIKKKS